MNLGSFLVGLAAPVIKRALVSLGVGVVSYAAIGTAVNSALNAAKTAWAGLAGEALALVQIAGVNTYISIIAGAIVARLSLQVLKKFEVMK